MKLKIHIPQQPSQKQTKNNQNPFEKKDKNTNFNQLIQKKKLPLMYLHS